MSRRRLTSPAPRPAVTAERAGRLYRLIEFLSEGPRAREVLTRRLGLDVRGFYRDLELLRDFGVSFGLTRRGYSLAEPTDTALAKLPFPDPLLSLHEAMQLSTGRTGAHKKLKQLIEQITGRPARAPKLPKKG
jgi:hypothetical protein